MKRTRAKNIFRGIRTSLNRFLSIMFIVALGSGFMAGLAATSPDMYATADSFMDELAWYDVDLKATLGMAGEDADAVAGLERVETVMPARVMDMVLDGPKDKTYASRVYAVLDEAGDCELNRFRLTEGRLPSAPGECVIQIVSGRYSSGSISLGDKLSLSRDNAGYQSLTDSMNLTELTVVGFVESPMAISIVSEPTNVGAGKVALDVYVSRDLFSFDYYTDVFVTLKGAAALDTFSEQYEELVNLVTDDIRTLGEAQSKLRTEAVKSDAQSGLDSLNYSAALLRQVLEINRSLGEDTVSRLTQTAATMAMTAQSSPVLASLLGDTLNNIRSTLEQSSSDKADDMLADLDDEIADAQEKLNSLEDSRWIIRTRADSSAYSSVDSNVGKVAALSKIFPVFFFMVALLVALTTMTRLVEENRGQMGTLKALGFTNGQILGEYIMYSLLSSVLGCVLGFAVGFRLFPLAISSAYSMMFNMPQVSTPIRPDIVLWVAPVTIISIMLATLWACYSEYRAAPAALMQPKAPAAGKRIWLEHLPFIWNRMSFTHKVTCRNLFRYKKRFFMTVIGVAGCSALLLTGFGLHDSINDIVDKQYGEIYKYQLSIMADDATAAAADPELVSLLSDTTAVDSWTVVSDSSGKAISGDKQSAVTLCIPQAPDKFGDFITLRERRSGDGIAFPDSGVVLTEKLCEELGIKAGDEVTLENADGIQSTTTVAGVTENYISSHAYLSEATYRDMFGTAPDYTTLLCILTDNTAADGLISDVMATGHVFYASSSVSLKDSFADSIKSINGVVIVLILAAGLLSAVVLYNLTNVNICERRRELATIRVLGFHKIEVEQYIFRETNLLSFIGSLAGLAVGIWLHSFVVRTVEVDMVMFGRDIYPLSYLAAFMISVIFTLLVNCIMRRQIRRVDMVEAMKAND